MSEEFLFTEKYRPKKVEDCILPDSIKLIFQNFVDQKNIPNLILSGTPGTGKTTIARAMLEELGSDYIIINGSLNAGIDVLRNEITNFASTVSFAGGRKYVILDEADFLNPNSVMPALRSFIEEYSKNCGFILTCNYKNRIIPALHSRCNVIDFRINKSDRASLSAQFFKRLLHILKEENVEFEKEAVAEIINNFYPDWRRVLNEIQKHSSNGGKITKNVLSTITAETFKPLVEALKEKNFIKMRKWVGENIDIDANSLYRHLFDNMFDYIKKESIPSLVLTIGEAQYKNAFVADQEINTVACLTEIMGDVEFK